MILWDKYSKYDPAFIYINVIEFISSWRYKQSTIDENSRIREDYLPKYY